MDEEDVVIRGGEDLGTISLEEGKPSINRIRQKI